MPPSTSTVNFSRMSTSLVSFSCLSRVSLVSLSCLALVSLVSRVPHLNPNRNSECVARGPRQAPIILYMRLIDSCITQLKAQAPLRTCNESKEEEEEAYCMPLSHSSSPVSWDCLMRNCPPPMGPPQGPRHRPTEGCQVAVVSYERGTFVRYYQSQPPLHPKVSRAVLGGANRPSQLP